MTELEHLKRYFEGSISAKEAFLKEGARAAVEAARKMVETLQEGGKILVCGNGGSAADSQHFAAELVCRFEKERRALPAIALSTDTSILTAWANDYSFETVFARQIEALGAEGDILVGISTSGNSPDVIRAVEAAKKMGIYTIGLLGKDGGALAPIVDLTVIAGSSRTAHIQECHQAIYHFWCEAIERAI